MRGQLIIDAIPTGMVNNKVLVGVEDTFGTFTSKGGIIMVNLTEEDSWGDSAQYNISEFVMRHGKVLLVPKVISRGTFSYDTDCELKVGDTVFWNLISFQQHVPLVYNKQLFLMVDYHEILAYKREDKITPVNGMGLFTPVQSEKKALSYAVQNTVTDEWILDAKPVTKVKYKDDRRSYDENLWQVGDKVRLLVGSSPFKLEGTIKTTLDKQLYACPMNFIICTC